MADGTSKALMLDKMGIDGKSVLIVQNKSASPFFHSLLAHSAKLGRSICLVSFNQNFSYYHNIGSRLGGNLKTLQTQNKLVFIGGLSTLKDSLNQPDAGKPFEFLFCQTEKPTQRLISILTNEIKKLGSTPFTLFIDELNCLLNYGVDVKQVVSFYQECHLMALGNETVNNGALIVSSGQTSGDTDANQCSSLLSHWSDLVLHEMELQTGLSKDLSGTVTMAWNIAPFHQQQYQFKSFERGIRMFAPGTCSAVL